MEKLSQGQQSEARSTCDAVVLLWSSRSVFAGKSRRSVDVGVAAVAAVAVGGLVGGRVGGVPASPLSGVAETQQGTLTQTASEVAW